ncbi:MAG: hypothetical protein CO113_17445 [Elusimicrobia bacterium CG_4_9_14_3_um_filter_62_55]|nr:MAG: hypothetical protein COR54_19345 [Elusimicrobia bacterium CG22_combo_CG10-13_8_21_14_all_63_91]PJB23729.1 MAG: hypothetical protein CO113_17445 [Elusimicrobia bacterium CG_4_9_14_3_um_filter_62_55]
MSKRRKNKNKKKKGHHAAAGGADAPASHDASRLEKDADAWETEVERLSARGKKVIGGGIAVLALGFFILTLTDPSGRNWASTLSPILILGAYAIIFFGIFLPDPAAREEGGETEKDIEASTASFPESL